MNVTNNMLGHGNGGQRERSSEENGIELRPMGMTYKEKRDLLETAAKLKTELMDCRN